MFQRAAQIITDWMLKKGILEKDKLVVCKWGLSHILDTVFNLTTFLIIGILFHMPIETIIFTIDYIPLRIFAGGYHAKTPFRCWLVSATLLLLSLIILHYVNKFMIMFEIAAVIAVIIILIAIPVEDAHKPLDTLERRKYRKCGIFILALEFAIASILMILHIKKLAFSICVVWIMLSSMMLLGSIKNYLFKRKLKV